MRDRLEDIPALKTDVQQMLSELSDKPPKAGRRNKPAAGMRPDAKGKRK